jgi:hypothetical protein
MTKITGNSVQQSRRSPKGKSLREPCRQPSPIQGTGPERRSGLIRAIGLLLILQAVGLVSTAVYHASRFNWDRELRDTPSSHALDALAIVGLFALLAILALLAAIGFLLVHRSGWLMAMLVQGATLLICLIYYFRQGPFLVYPVMVYCVIMVLYLNSFNVQAVFQHRAMDQEQESLHDRGSHGG